MIIILLMFVFVLIFFMAPIIIATNRKKLREMDRLITEFRDTDFRESFSDRAAVKVDLISKLARIKAGISIADKAATEAARDLITLASSL